MQENKLIAEQLLVTYLFYNIFVSLRIICLKIDQNQ